MIEEVATVPSILPVVAFCRGCWLPMNLWIIGFNANPIARVAVRSRMLRFAEGVRGVGVVLLFPETTLLPRLLK